MLITQKLFIYNFLWSINERKVRHIRKGSIKQLNTKLKSLLAKRKKKHREKSLQKISWDQNNSLFENVLIWNYSDPYFPAFGLNISYISVFSPKIVSRKIGTRITSNTDTFDAVTMDISEILKTGWCFELSKWFH